MTDTMLEKLSQPAELEKKWGDVLSCPPPAPSHVKGKLAMTLPPPNVTGTLHIGHALTYTLQDVWIRFWRMQGFEVLAQPGLDHAGIATQMMVERHLAKKNLYRQSLGRQKFFEEAMTFKEATGDVIINQLKRLGVSANWDRLMFTLDQPVQDAVREVFVSLFNEGLIYQSERLVYWDTHFQTALSNLEVKNKDVAGNLWTLRYTRADDPQQFIDIATTRPETLFGDQAVAVHPNDARYQGWVGKHVYVPLTTRTIPIIADDRVEQNKGTGALKITPAHDFLDFDIGQTHNLTALSILDEGGHLNAQVPEAFQGLTVSQARQAVLEALKQEERLIAQTPVTHAVPYGDRSDTVLEPRITKQWFLNVKPLAEKALNALDTQAFAFLPEHYAGVYRHWLTHIEPWCLSRQLWWGHAIPAWYGPDGHVFVATSAADAEAHAQAHYGKPVTLTPDEDVLDTWFSSALWPFVTLGWPEKTTLLSDYYPTQTLITGFDIIFFWVARMVMMGTHFTGKPPFREVYIHGLVRDLSRQKMSKTKGNVVNPLDVMDEYGADALRLSLATLSTPGHDIAFGTHHVELSRNFLTKLWNAARFALSKGMTWPSSLVLGNIHPLHAWLVQEITAAHTTYLQAMKEGRFYEAAHTIYHLVWRTYCDQYIEMSKALLQEDMPALTEEVQHMGGWALGCCLHMLYPFSPFMTTELWSHLAPHASPLYATCWPKDGLWPRPDKNTGQTPSPIHDVLLWAEEIRRIRALLQIPPKTSLPVVALVPTFISKHRFFVERFLNVTFESDDPHKHQTGGMHGVVNGLSFFMKLAGVVDMHQARQHLAKKKEKISSECLRLHNKMKQPHFTEKAPAHLVAETQDKLEALSREEDLISHLLSHMRVTT